jgi:hypothetical protein
MNRYAVVEAVRSLRKPVYMVTGLKTAKGPSIKVSQSHSTEAVAEAGAQAPGAVLVEFGPRFRRDTERKLGVEWDRSDDFIIGIRLTKL